MDTMNEKVGDVILGTPFVKCYHNTKFNSKGILKCIKNPLTINGFSDTVSWTKKETKPGGWHREVPMELNVSSFDPSRETALYTVISVKKVPSCSEGYGGGTQITIKREGFSERIVYTRNCHYCTDLSVPVTLAPK